MDVDEILARCSIPTPCPMDWDAMHGDDRVRFCDRCGKHVYNLTAMGQDEAGALLTGIRERGERRCIRIYQRPDGTLTTSSCHAAPPDAAPAWQYTIRFLMTIIAACATLLGLSKWLSRELEPHKAPPATSNQVIGGDVY